MRMEFVKGVAVWVVAFLAADGIIYAFRKKRKK